MTIDADGPGCAIRRDVGSGENFLTNAFHLSAADIERLDGGQVVSRTLEVMNQREVATLGIVRISTSPSTYVERLADITAFKRTPGVLQIGTFGNPSAAARHRVAEHRRADLKRLRECRVEDATFVSAQMASNASAARSTGLA